MAALLERVCVMLTIHDMCEFGGWGGGGALSLSSELCRNCSQRPPIESNAILSNSTSYPYEDKQI